MQHFPYVACDTCQANPGYKKNYWHIPAGLPTHKHPVRIAHVKKEAVPTDGYALKDEGKFREVYNQNIT